jgi:hypothetical protein
MTHHDPEGTTGRERPPSGNDSRSGSRAPFDAAIEIPREQREPGIEANVADPEERVALAGCRLDEDTSGSSRPRRRACSWLHIGSDRRCNLA